MRLIKPHRIAKLADRPFTLLAIGADGEDRDRLVEYLVPMHLPPAPRNLALACLEAAEADDGRLSQWIERADAVVMTPRARAVPRAWAAEPVTLDPDAPAEGAMALLRLHADLLLAFGRRFPVLRPFAARALIQSVAMRNAAIAALSAIPEVVPTPLGLVWAVGEFASDTVALTANQIRLALQLAALHGDAVGWTSQTGEILFILGGAFGWRALARTLVSLVPAGVGMAAKSTIAYGGTVAVGRFLWRRYTPQPRRAERLSPRLVEPPLAGGRRPRRLPPLTLPSAP